MEAIPTLQALAEHGETPLDIVEGALAFSLLRDRKRVAAPIMAHLDRLCEQVAEAVSRQDAELGASGLPAERGLSALNHVLLGLNGYSGDAEDYDDLDNADLARVIDRRKGLPVALSILYMHVGRAQGWQVEGLAFPGHFLIRIGRDGQWVIADPFHEGAVLDAPALRALLKAMSGADAELSPAHYSPVPDRDVLLRLQNNIKVRLIRQRDYDGAADVLDGMLTLSPDDAVLWRESGLVNAKVGKVKAAIRALEHYMDRETSEAARQEAADLVADLKSRVN